MRFRGRLPGSPLVALLFILLRLIIIVLGRNNPCCYVVVCFRLSLSGFVTLLCIPGDNPSDLAQHLLVGWCSAVSIRVALINV